MLQRELTQCALRVVRGQQKEPVQPDLREAVLSQYCKVVCREVTGVYLAFELTLICTAVLEPYFTCDALR